MKKLLSDFGLGFSTSFEALGFVFKNKLAHYFLYPIAMILALAAFSANQIDKWSEVFSKAIIEWLGFSVTTPDGWWESFLMFLQKATEIVLEYTLYFLFIYVAHKLMKYAVLILMSPIMALLSEKTEEILTGNEYPFDFGQFMKDIWRGVLIAIRNLFMEVLIIIGVMGTTAVFSWIFPPLMIIVGPLSTLFLFFIGAYFYGFSTMDYTNERRRLNVKQSVQFIRHHKGIATGNGTVFSLLLIVPILGTYIGPIFAPIICSVGATLAIHKRVNLGTDDYYLYTQKEKDRVDPDKKALDER